MAQHQNISSLMDKLAIQRPAQSSLVLRPTLAIYGGGKRKKRSADMRVFLVHATI